MQIRVAIIGVGNCCSSLVQAVEAAKKNILPATGVAFERIGNYSIGDIEFSTAFDIDTRKVGIDLSQAIYFAPNCTTNYFSVPPLSVNVCAGKILDGVGEHMHDLLEIIPPIQENGLDYVTQILQSTNTHIVISYLPVGSDAASEFYAEAALNAGCAFINCMPSKIANSEIFKQKFTERKLPLLGDDIKSQIGSTAIHRSLISLLQDKGAKINSTYQLNIGGNTDFKNMRNGKRAKGKKFTKEISLNHLFNNDVAIGVGPSDYVPFLKDYKVGYINIEGTALLGMPFSIELKLKVEDSPNSAGVALNAIRAAKVAIDEGIYGIVEDACPYLFKNPPTKLNESETSNAFKKFLF